MKSAGVLLLLGVALSTFSAVAPAAQTYPARPIRFIVPFPPGGNVDLIARIIGHKLSDVLGKQVVIDNRVGAAGIIGTEMAAKAPSDGYTMLMGSIGALSINPSYYKKLPYDTLRSFAPVTLVATTPNILVVYPSLPANSVQELIALARARPGQFNFASGGTGGSAHLAAELLKTMAGINIVHIPYKGIPQGITDLIAGRVQIMTPPMPAIVPHIKSGQLKALAVSSVKRNSAMPELPTIAEAGVPGYQADAWYGVLVPAGTAKPIIAKLNAEISRLLILPDISTYLTNQGAQVSTTTPEQFAAFIKDEIAKWAYVIKSAGIQVE